MLATKHNDLQNLVSILIEQNKEIIMQNRQFVMKMNKMDEKYRKKLETLIFMMLWKQNGEKGFVMPPQITNFLRSIKNE